MSDITSEKEKSWLGLQIIIDQLYRAQEADRAKPPELFETLRVLRKEFDVFPALKDRDS